MYVFDTNSLSVLNNYYPTTFATLWGRIDGLAAAGDLISVREAYNELQNYPSGSVVKTWAAANRAIFLTPSAADTTELRRILAVPHFQQMITAKAILKGTPVADPFVVAAAIVRGATVVTEEELKPNAAKIPNVCQHFGVPCMNLADVMRAEGWNF